jgi:hypothetical protein
MRSRNARRALALTTAAFAAAVLVGTTSAANPRTTLDAYRLANSEVVMPFHCQQHGCSMGWMKVREIDDRTAILTLRVVARFSGSLLPQYRRQAINRINQDLLRRGRAKGGVLISPPRTTFRENFHVLLSDVAWRMRR